MQTDSDETEFTGPLLEYLRRALGQATVEYAAPPVRLSGGNENDLFSFQLRAAAEPFDQPLVARIYPAWETVMRARYEAAVHGAVAEQGFAVPRVFFTGAENEGLGRPFLIMERVSGCTMLDTVRRPSPLLLLRLPSVLAGVAAALHRLDAEAVLAAVDAAGVERELMTSKRWERKARGRVAHFGFTSLEALAEWLDRHRPGPRKEVITHGDIHPQNLMILNGRGTALLDWSRTAAAPAEFEIASSRILIGYSPSGFQGLAGRLVEPYRWWFLRRFEACYRAEHPVDEKLVRYFEMFRAFSALAGIAARRAARAREPDPPDFYSFEGPRVAKLVARVAQISGIRVELPPLA